MRKNRKLESPIVGYGKENDEKKAIRNALSHLPLEGFISKEDIVVITANMVNPNPPEKGVVVGQESLREVIRFFKERNPKRIIVVGGAGSTNTKNVLHSIGFDKIIEQEGIEFLDLNFGPFIEIDIGGKIVQKTKINSIIQDATIIVSFTQLKAHEEATMSACIKNIALTWPPAEVHGYPKKNLGIHDELHDFIVSMAKNIPIDLSILSLSPSMIGTGPSKGVAKNTNMVLASLDPVAIDTVGARLLGFRPQAVNYLFMCIKEGIGQGTVDNIELKGVKLVDIEKEFSKVVYGEEFSIDE